MLTNKEKQLPEGMFMDRELNASVGRKVIMLLDIHDHAIKKNKSAGIMEMVLSLDKLNNDDNLEDRSLSNILLRYHVTSSDEFTCFEPVAPQCKQLRNRAFAP